MKKIYEIYVRKNDEIFFKYFGSTPIEDQAKNIICNLRKNGLIVRCIIQTHI